MIYVICRDLSEIKYPVNAPMRVVINSAPLYLGEIGAWDQIFRDVVINDFKTVGIYQARRGFHKDLKLLKDEDFIVDDSSIYCTIYDENISLNEQFKNYHPKYGDLLEKMTPDAYKPLLQNRFIYPHNMFYCTQKTFYLLYAFINEMKNQSALLDYVNDKNKIFSLLAERFLTLWYIKNNLNIKFCNAFVCDKVTKNIINNYNGIGE